MKHSQIGISSPGNALIDLEPTGPGKVSIDEILPRNAAPDKEAGNANHSPEPNLLKEALESWDELRKNKLSRPEIKLE